jgi:hypothetical protein
MDAGAQEPERELSERKLDLVLDSETEAILTTALVDAVLDVLKKQVDRILLNDSYWEDAWEEGDAVDWDSDSQSASASESFRTDPKGIAKAAVKDRRVREIASIYDAKPADLVTWFLSDDGRMLEVYDAAVSDLDPGEFKKNAKSAAEDGLQDLRWESGKSYSGAFTYSEIVEITDAGVDEIYFDSINARKYELVVSVWADVRMIGGKDSIL